MRSRLIAALRGSTLVTLAFAGACATGPALPAGPAPEQLPFLEGRLNILPNDPELLWRAGAAKLAGGDAEGAQEYLERAVATPEAPMEATFFLGLALEELEEFEGAIDAYVSYQAADAPGAAALDGRLRLLRRQALQASVRASLEMEAQLSQTTPSANTVAVFPFEFASNDASLQPLSRALAEMLITDLSVTDRLQVVERVQIQALLDEMVMGLGGLVDEGTATRAGYLVGAGQVVQGRIDGTMESLQLDASVVALASPNADGPTSSQQDAASQLLDMEKQMALELYAALGINLTAAERARVNERPTENLQAILAYGLGLEASDRGDFAEAARQFNQAVRIDPNFSRAQTNAQESEQTQEASTTSASDLATAAALPEIDATNLGLLDLGQRDVAAEAAGTEGVVQRTLVEIILRTGGGE